jgi:hypothetical protein
VKEATGMKIIYSPTTKVKHRVDNNRLKLSYIAPWAYWAGYSKQKLKKSYRYSKNNILNQEYGLLRRIITKLFPRLLVQFPGHPLRTSRSVLFTSTVLCCVAMGYFVGLFSSKNNIEYKFTFLDGGVS